MTIHPLAVDDLLAALRGATGDQPGSSGEAVDSYLVDLDRGSDLEPPPALHAGFRGVVIGVTSSAEPLGHPMAGTCDVVLGSDDPWLDQVREQVTTHPIAAAALASLLRGATDRTIDGGLLAESAVYSSLQAGPEFAAWLGARERRRREPQGDAVAVTRAGATVVVTLQRPDVRNALSTRMRDQLVDAFALVAADPSIERVELRGAGPSFCSGGDLDEFGTMPDPASAHLLRLQRSAGRAIAVVAERVTAYLHGDCVGSGIELPAFAGTVVARRDARMSLPEVSLGLIPGAGGTVSLPRRIGRHRTAALALSGAAIDADTALAWGLVDALER